MEIVNAKEFMLLAKETFFTGLATMKGKQRDGITEAQKETLRHLGIGHSKLHYKGEAIRVINVAIERMRSGLATPGQMRMMAEKGVSIVHKRTFNEAKYILSDGDPDKYDGLMIVIKYDTVSAKNMKATATSRNEAKELFNQIKANGGSNFRFQTIG